MPYKMSIELQNTLITAMIDCLAGGRGSLGIGRLRVFAGAQPPTPDVPITVEPLVTIPNLCWGVPFTEIPNHFATITPDTGSGQGTIVAQDVISFNTIWAHAAHLVVDNGNGKGVITADVDTPYGELFPGAVIELSGTTENNYPCIVESCTENEIICTTPFNGSDEAVVALEIYPQITSRYNLLSQGSIFTLSGASDCNGVYEIESVNGSEIVCTGVIAGTEPYYEYDSVKLSPPTALLSQLIASRSYNGIAERAGWAGWGRLDFEGGDRPLIVDGDVGINDWNTFTINAASINVGDTVSLLNADILVY